MSGNSSGIVEFSNKLETYIFRIVNREFFNYLLPFILLTIYIICKKGKRVEKEKNNISTFLYIPLIIYFLILAVNAPYIEIRYIIPIYSIFTITYVYTVKSLIEKYHNQNVTTYCTLCILIVTLISPIVTKTKLEMTYAQYNSIAKRVEESKLPIIYIFNTSNNRFLDDIYLFTRVDKSIVVDDKISYEVILKSQNTEFILICNEGVDEEKVKSYLQNREIEYMQRMNACNIYIIH